MSQELAKKAKKQVSAEFMAKGYAQGISVGKGAEVDAKYLVRMYSSDLTKAKADFGDTIVVEDCQDDCEVSIDHVQMSGCSTE